MIRKTQPKAQPIKNKQSEKNLWKMMRVWGAQTMVILPTMLCSQDSLPSMEQQGSSQSRGKDFRQIKL